MVELATERLTLRPPRMDDVPACVDLLADPDIAAMTATIPHPYTEDDGRKWIELTQMAWREGKGTPFAAFDRMSGVLVGAAGLGGTSEEPELGYWVGKPFWGKGYATEASKAVIDLAFRGSGIVAIKGRCRPDNPASARVLEKCGFVYGGDGVLSSTIRGDLPARLYRLSRANWEAMQ